MNPVLIGVRCLCNRGGSQPGGRAKAEGRLCLSVAPSDPSAEAAAAADHFVHTFSKEDSSPFFHRGGAAVYTVQCTVYTLCVCVCALWMVARLFLSILFPATRTLTHTHIIETHTVTHTLTHTERLLWPAVPMLPTLMYTVQCTRVSEYVSVCVT